VAVALTIAGATKAYRIGSLNLPKPVNGRGTASFDVRSNDGTYRPAMDAEVILTENGTRIFGGLVDRPSERGILGDATGAYEGITTRVSAVDFHHYTERRVVSETIPAGSLEDALTVLVTYLTPFGVTLSGSQVTGPSLPELVYENRPLTEVLNEISALTANYGDPYVWRIDYFKVLSMYQPSVEAAPFNITDGDENTVGDLIVDTSREQYANRIIMRMPARSEINRVDTFTGDGSTSSFTLSYTLTGMRYIVTNDGVDELLTFEGIGFDLAVQWLYYASDNTIRRMTTGVADPPDNGNVITVTYDGTYSATGVAAEDAGEIATYGPWEKVLVVENVPSDTTAQAMADAELARRLLTPKTIKYKTFEVGVEPGQTQTIVSALRNLNESCVITDVVIRDYGKGDRLIREVTATSGTTPQSGWRDKYKVWSGDKLGKGTPVTSVPSVGGGFPAAVGPAPPNKAVQFNDNGPFGGDAAFTYDKDTNSIICGDDSSITAATPSHCLIVGPYCEIADPA
jgi:hypothetical protein